ncbi:Pyruvate/Phosphoenolpyruvate kinase-like domain-containing protein [Chytridium lagenaria]|nr:Pyruvate/Phosphoenolpyruvate kinase-like domain-containing protein [Chytridium lagenaria]
MGCGASTQRQEQVTRDTTAQPSPSLEQGSTSKTEVEPYVISVEQKQDLEKQPPVEPFMAANINRRMSLVGQSQEVFHANQHLTERKTKIVGTLGPASFPRSRNSSSLVRSFFTTNSLNTFTGVNVFRLNFSHVSDPETQTPIITKIRDESRELGLPVAILGDLGGPKIRCNVFKDGSIDLAKGQTVVFKHSDEPGSDGVINTTIPQIVWGSSIALKVLERVSKEESACWGSQVDLPALTDKDKRLDYIALSFVQKPEIINVADGIMVARGDLGVECSLEQFKRRERNADGTDAVMLSAECEGQYPIETEMMASICRNSEAGNAIMNPKHINTAELTIYRTMHQRRKISEFAHSIADAATAAADEANATAMIVFTTSSEMAVFVSKRRPRMSIIAVTPTTPSTDVSRLTIGKGKLSKLKNDDGVEAVAASLESLTSAKMTPLKVGDPVVFCAGEIPSPVPGLSNTIKMARFGDSNKSEKRRSLWKDSIGWAKQSGSAAHLAGHSTSM